MFQKTFIIVFILGIIFSNIVFASITKEHIFNRSDFFENFLDIVYPDVDEPIGDTLLIIKEDNYTLLIVPKSKFTKIIDVLQDENHWIFKFGKELTL